MNVLHIANYYIGAKVYKNLVEVLDQNGVKQTIYTAFSGSQLAGANNPDLSVTGSGILYRPILNTLTRLHYLHKVKKITADILASVSTENFDCIHAHTLFSDGRIAYNLWKQFDVPYIVTIRNTDLNFFFRYFLHLRGMAKSTLLNAKQIIFISEAYRRRMLAHPYFCKFKNELEAKSVVIPNGIDQYWLNNTAEATKPQISSPAQLLFVGKISKGKNLLKLMGIVEKLNDEGNKCMLHIAGGGSGNYFKDMKQRIGKYPHLFVYHGIVKDKALLLSLYRKSDLFVMPSRKETFGLVYVEALSQGIPVIYTKNEGIDGLFPPETGEPVNCNNDEEIAAGIRTVLQHYSKYNFAPRKITEPFSWKHIAQKYLYLYRSCSNN